MITSTYSNLATESNNLNHQTIRRCIGGFREEFRWSFPGEIERMADELIGLDWSQYSKVSRVHSMFTISPYFGYANVFKHHNMLVNVMFTS